MKKDELRNLLRQIPFPESAEEANRIRKMLQDQGIDLAALYRQMEMSSRFVDAHMDVNYAGDTVEVHSHRFFELVYCVSGGEMAYHVENETEHLVPGDILFLPPGVRHGPIIPSHLSEPYLRYVLWLSPEFVHLNRTIFLNNGETMPEEMPHFILHTAGSTSSHLSECFRRCVQECEQQAFRYETAVFGIATDLMVQIARFWRTDTPLENPPALLEKIVHHVETHLGERITLADVASQFWVSQSTISQLFRNRLGISFYRYVTQRRLNESLLMIQSGLPMEQISISVGFQDYSSFYRAFKSEFGLSPGQYRKNLQ